MTCDCGAVTVRGKLVRGIWVCPECKPEEFIEPLPKTPIEKNCYMGWEANPNEYIKQVAPDGRPMYIAKDWAVAEGEAKMARKSDDEKAAEEAILAKRRAGVRKKPLTEAEKEVALRRARAIAEQYRKDKEAANSGLAN